MRPVPDGAARRGSPGPGIASTAAPCGVRQPPPDARDAEEWLRLATAGDFAGAWQVTDRIRARNGSQSDWTQPRHLQQIWDGRHLNGRRVLIRCYHGLGDTIQFIRYAPLVRSVAREVIVWAQPALIPLLHGAAGIDRLLPLHDGAPDVAFDVDVEIMELPYIFRSVQATLPMAVPYLTVEAVSLADPKPRVGVVWRGGDWDRRRSMPFDLLSELFDIDAVSWYRLQFDTAPGERHPKLRMFDTTSVLKTAQVMRALDVVISIDSLSAHLAGALAIPVWTLLPYEADWRWMLAREDSPWYPTMRLFRQRQAGEWRDVLDQVRGALLQTFA